MKEIVFNKTFTVEQKRQPRLFSDIDALLDERAVFEKELSDWYGKPMQWVNRKYPDRIQRAFAVSRKENDHNFNNLMQRINHG